MSDKQSTSAAPEISRDKVIVRTSIVGILTNVFLAVFKAVVGIIANSIAVTLDAVNNLSDALSSVITIVGTKLAGKLPDKKHPLGYGRIEYLSTMIISALVLYAGITAMVESVKKLFHPEAPDYSALTLIILAAAVAVKLMLGSYFRRTGKRVSSGSLQASGSDALSDAILSAAGKTVQTRGNYNNEVGLPLSLFSFDESVRFGVFEAGVSHPGDMPPLAEAMRPTAVVFSTLGESHLLAFGTREAIAREKGLLARDLPADGFLVFGADDPLEALYASSAPASARRVRVSFDGAPNADWRARLEGGTLLLARAATGETLHLPVPSPVAIQSRNLARAAAAARELGIPADAIARGAAAFSAEPGRWQRLATPGGLTVIHDAYNASPTSFASALTALAREAPAAASAVVAGPMLELGGAEAEAHRRIGGLLASGGYKAVVILSREGVPFAEDAAANLLAAAFPAGAENLLATDAQRLSRHAWRTAPRSLRERLTRFFFSRCVYPAGGKTFHILMSQLAQELNDSRLNVSVELNSMQADGLLSLHRGRIEIPLLERLLM